MNGTANAEETVPREGASMRGPAASQDALSDLQRVTFDYFLYETNPSNGLVADSTQKGVPASIAAVGLALAAYPIGVACGFVSREEAAARTLTTLHFFRDSPQGTAADATGYKGFYYHFLDRCDGRRAWHCELSTIDSTLLFAGMLAAAAYFDRDTAVENEIRSAAAALYARADWRWATNGGATVTHGWTPENGFLPYRWQGYNEALLLYALALGSPTYALPAECYRAWAATYQWREVYGYEYLYAGPLFIHQLPHVWIDFRGIQDEAMRSQRLDYFENSRRATYAQQAYAADNPQQFVGYGKTCWAITASPGPGWVTCRVGGRQRQFYGYVGRGVPDGPDDGTIAPWAVVASLPFAPEIVLPTLRYFDEIDLAIKEPYGFKATFNRTFPVDQDGRGWVWQWHCGLNQGPIVLMIENYRSELLWRLMRRCQPLVAGLRRAGFTGGWLDG
jgi:hypothetical protein